MKTRDFPRLLTTMIQIHEKTDPADIGNGYVMDDYRLECSAGAVLQSAPKSAAEFSVLKIASDNYSLIKQPV